MSLNQLKRSESVHIITAWLVLSFCFSVSALFSQSFLLVFTVSLLTLGVGFIFHELVHRFTARRFGYIARFRLWVWGLVMALFLAVLSGGRFIFAAPGAVYILPSLRYGWDYGEIEKRQIGIISVAGPLANMALGSGFYLISLFGGIMSYIGFQGFVINFWLAAFNMIPLGPMDGSKVFRWSHLIWIAVTAPAWIVTFLSTF